MPVIKERFDAIGDVYAKYKMDPLNGYLENEKFSRPQLLDFAKSMGRQAKKPFREALAEMYKKSSAGLPNTMTTFTFSETASMQM